MYFEGRIDGKKDVKEALKWYKKSADLGDTDAMVMVGQFYIIGEAGTQEERRSPSHGAAAAKRYFMQARALGNTNAQGHLDRVRAMGL